MGQKIKVREQEQQENKVHQDQKQEVYVRIAQIGTQNQSTLGASSTGNGIKAFIVMPFSKEYEDVYSAIKQACLEAGVEAVRADEIIKPGPIINQIFDNISTADLVIAEAGSKNSNVYYEIAIAHCREKPSILIARLDELDALPFDIRHNRVIPYNDYDLGSLTVALTKSLRYLKETIIGAQTPASLEEHLEDLAAGSEQKGIALQNLISQVGAEFGFTNPKLDEWSYLPEERVYSIRIRDDFYDKAVFTLDVNGNIKRKKRIS